MSRRPMLVAAVALFIACSTAFAGKPPLDRVTPHAAWMLHVDVERANDSVLGQEIVGSEDEFDLDLDDLEDEMGIDPQKDLYSFTVYGRGDDPEENVVVLLEMTDAIDDALAKAREEEETLREITVDGHDLYTWSDGAEDMFASVSGPDERGRRHVVVGKQSASVVEALEIRAGERASLADAVKAKKADLPKPQKGSLVYAFARDISWIDAPDDGAMSAIVSMSKRFVLDVGEVDGEADVRLIVVADDATDAGRIVDIVRGLIALGQVLLESDPEAANALDGISIEADGGEITFRIRAPSEDLVSDARKASKEM